MSKSKWLRHFFIVLVFLSFSCLSLFAQTDSIKHRPKIGLVLSGGGAKGLAHIGVLKMIEKYNIPIDYITGTSMGSIIGALYSIGYSADQIEKIAASMNWDEIFDGSTKRRLISIEEKDQEGKFVLEVPVKKGMPVIPTGLISGQKLEMELANITWSVHSVNDFSKLPIPFACIATDIETGKAVVLNKGYLPDAIRASMAIPSVFTAVEIDGHLLVDGGLVRNFPVSDAREMGADIIIGVDVQAPLYKKEQLNSMLKIMEQAASFLNDETNKEQTKLVDILIKPNIEGYDASSFSDADTLIDRGEIAAQKNEYKFIELKNKLSRYPDNTKQIRTPPSLYSIFIHKVKYEGLKKVSKGLVESKLHIKDSSWVTLSDIEKGVAMVYGSKYFEKVNYRIVQEGDNVTDLVIRVTEQPFSIYKIGINYNYYFNASLLLNGTYRNILGEGSRLILSTKLGADPEFLFDYTIFTKWRPSVGFRLQGEYYNLEETVYGIWDSLNISINNNSFFGRIGFASSISNSLLFSLGGEVSYKKLEPTNIQISNSLPERTGIKLFSLLKLDTYDRNIYPTNGALFLLNVGYMLGELKKTDADFDKRYWQFSLNYQQYFQLGEKLNYHHFIMAGASLADSLFYNDRFFLGGQINFKNYVFPLKGYRFMELMGQDVVSAGMAFRYEPWNGKFIFLEGNAGIAENKLEKLIEPGQIYYGGSLGFGLRTVIGPIEYKISVNSSDVRVNHWIQIGYYF